MKKLSIILYSDEKGNEPVVKWLQSIKNYKERSILQRRIAYLENGNLGDYKSLGDGLYGLRFFFGSGYRIYFAKQDDDTLILLYGGNKSSQTKDIKKAQEYLKNYLTNKNA